MCLSILSSVGHSMITFFREESLDRFDEDSEAERDEEYGIDECAYNFCSLPSICECAVPCFFGDLYSVDRDSECEDIAEHMKCIGDERKTVDRVSDNYLYEEHGCAKKKHKTETNSAGHDGQRG
jgi:hypothetical protein